MTIRTRLADYDHILFLTGGVLCQNKELQEKQFSQNAVQKGQQHLLPAEKFKQLGVKQLATKI